MSIPTHFAILAHYSRMRQVLTNRVQDTSVRRGLPSKGKLVRSITSQPQS
jgi:hypothetical protein